MEVQEQCQKKVVGNALYTSVKSAYRQYKLDLDYVKNNSIFWKGKTYLWGRTHLSIAWHNIYWRVIKR